MRWFEGDVVAAIAETKRAGALFVVYITGGKDAEEKHMSSLWSSVEPERDLPWRVVAVKLAEGSQDAKNFAQIYPVPCFPCTYFIDMNGKPTNVVLFNKIEVMDAEKFREALPKLIFPIPGKEASSGLVRVDGSAPPSAPATVAAAPAPATVPLVTAPVTAPAAAPSTSSAEEIAEKIRKAKELLEKKKAAEEEKKRKEELARETQRREDAKEMHRIMEERRNKELLDAAAARRKDKLDSAKERERVKEQIKADKAERDARFRAQQQLSQAASTESSPTEETTRGIAAPQAVASDRCRIQVRFPDGSSALHDFPSADTLASLRQIVAADARVRGSSFRLAQPAPRRIYGDTEMEKSFLDLALTPASTLLVLTDASPVARVASAASAAVQPAYNPMTTLFNFVTYLIFTPIQFVLSMFGMGGGAARADGAEKKRDDPSPPSAASSHAAGDSASAASAAGAAARRRHQGRSNVHTLGSQNAESEQSAEDDQDANWNGNSTQYM